MIVDVYSQKDVTKDRIIDPLVCVIKGVKGEI